MSESTTPVAQLQYSPLAAAKFERTAAHLRAAQPMDAWCYRVFENSSTPFAPYRLRSRQPTLLSQPVVHRAASLYMRSLPLQASRPPGKWS
jgi:hypothetical protein